jgi:uncharacterized protein (DUF488 family)
MLNKVETDKDMNETNGNNAMQIFTIGYSGKNAREFFSLLKKAEIKKLIDVRLYNTSQLAGYTKRDDLGYFLETIAGADYAHLPVMAPTKQLLNDYKNGTISWAGYEDQFKEIITGRQIEKYIAADDLDMGCFLCAEATADNCHRRLVAEYLKAHWPNISIKHL